MGGRAVGVVEEGVVVEAVVEAVAVVVVVWEVLVVISPPQWSSREHLQFRHTFLEGGGKNVR